MAKAQFDWEFCKKNRTKEKYDLILRLHDKKVTEGQFLAEWAKLPRNKRKTGIAPSKYYSPSEGRQNYRNLRDKFGFFK